MTRHRIIVILIASSMVLFGGVMIWKRNVDKINAQVFVEIKDRIESLGDLPVDSRSVHFQKSYDSVEIFIDEKLIAKYVWKDDLYKPIMYDVRTLSGDVITRQVPFDKDQRNALDHPHHTGIFFTYGKVNGKDFWDHRGNSNKVKQVELSTDWDEQGAGRIFAVNRWISEQGHELLEEKRTMTFFKAKGGYVIDFDIDLIALNTKVIFEDTKEGLFGIRLADWLTEKKGTGRYFSSNGDQKEKNIWGTRANWVCLQGKKDNKTIGIAIIDMQDSVNHPTFWHARGYGLFSANPLGQYDFEKVTNRKKAKRLHLTLEPGDTAHFNFQIYIFESSMQ